MTRVLVLNAGSSSLKWSVFDAASENVLQQGSARWQAEVDGRQHAVEVKAALTQIDGVAVIGHRVVHGGALFRTPVWVDEAVRRGIMDLSELAPLHNPAALAGIAAAAARFPTAPQVAVFDTAFHATIADPQALYPLPWDWTQRWHLRRFGFHGLSVEYAVQRVTEILGGLPRRLAVCHLGGGCSVTAVLDGRSVDTSMGFTPLEGLMMSQRSGSIDPGLLLFLARVHGVTASEIDTALNERSGLVGVSGVSADMRDILAARALGNARADLAFDMFIHRLAATIGWLTTSLGGLDALVFSGGIGENSPDVRAATAMRLGYLGVSMSDEANRATDADRTISTHDSHVRLLVIASREDLAVLRAVKHMLQQTPSIGE